MARKRISIDEALRLARKSGWKFGKTQDFHAQSSSSKNADLVAIARLKGYRKPKTASGSTARYFFEYLNRKA